MANSRLCPSVQTRYADVLKALLIVSYAVVLALLMTDASAAASASSGPAVTGDRGTVGIDEALHHPGWRDGTFGPTGERLFTERLDRGLGIRGQFSYIHFAKLMDPVQLAIVREVGPVNLTEQAVEWYPSHIAVTYTGNGIAVSERKFITDDDVFVDVLGLSNVSSELFEGSIVYTSKVALQPAGVGSGANLLAGEHVFSGQETRILAGGAEFRTVATGGSPERRVRLEAGQSVQVVAVAAMGNSGSEWGKFGRWTQMDDPLTVHTRRYQQWFDDNCPRFECDDPYMKKCWWYRMFIMRHCLSRACVGNLPHPYFFEGTHESHFPRLIAFSSPHIIDEARWLRNGDYAWGQVLNHVRNPDDKDGYFVSARVDKKGGDYNNWITAAAWGLYMVHPNRTRLEKSLPAMMADVRGTLKFYDPDGNLLPAPRSHWTTGMEFQPSFFYFNDFDDTLPEAKLERPDFATYLYANAQAVAFACRELDQAKLGAEFDHLAQRIHQAVMAGMWDGKDEFFYSIRQGDRAVAEVREVVGFYPFAFQMTGNETVGAFKHLVDPAEFWTPFPPATVTKKCPAYTPKPEHWPAKGGKTHGCMWNGPSWPHATSVVLNALAAVVQNYRQDHARPEHFWRMLDRFTHMHFAGDDLGQPLLREYNHGETGEATGCPDYFHSTYCDIIVRHVVGLQPGGFDRLTLRPIPGPLKRFSLTGVRYRNHTLDIVYNSVEAGRAGEVGLRVWVDGQPAAYRDSLGELTVDLAGKKGF